MLILNALECRVLGALMEKSMANPEYYPMTENALVAACNQKQNRDPVMHLDGDAVWDTLESLRGKGLVTVQLPGAGARTKRFRHDVDSALGWHKRERAVMAELLLRGPQTPGELRSRCNRFCHFDDLAAIEMVLEHLAGQEPPAVRILPREPGRSAQRWTHLLAGDAPDAPDASAAVDAATAAAPAAASGPPAGEQDASGPGGLEALQAQLAALTARVAALEERLHAGPGGGSAGDAG
jgi:uncharacterized protein YceH (UPF0502 family)